MIRLQRTGRRNLPTYRVVVADKRAPVKGKFIEIIGAYLPQGKNPTFQVKEDRVGHWVKQGAIPSDTVARLLSRSGMGGMEKFIQRYTKRKKKGETTEEAAAPAAPAAEAPATAPEAPTGDSEAKTE